jgi:hypothetical protein
MRTLTVSEENEVSGGGWQFVLSVIAGLTANYLYEKAGGAEGIDAGVQHFLDSQPSIRTAYSGIGGK